MNRFLEEKFKLCLEIIRTLDLDYIGSAQINEKAPPPLKGMYDKCVQIIITG